MWVGFDHFSLLRGKRDSVGRDRGRTLRDSLLSTAMSGAASLPLQNLAVFVDVQNIYYTTRQRFAKNFDYNRFWSEITRGRRVVKAIAFATDRQDEKQRQFQNIIRAIGFEVKLRPFIQRSDGSAKADWDVGIALDVMEYAPLADVVVIASGDGDFDLLVQRVKDKFHVSVEVYGVADLTADSLVRAADRFVPIEGGLLLSSNRE
jgi:uncharacterized LabA/DUF88 family protein